MIRVLILIFLFISSNLSAEENTMILKLKDGDVKIELFPDVAPGHVKRIKELANSGKYNGVVFHRVIDGFMAQTGDVQFGNSESKEFNLSRAGMGGSDLPDLKAKFSNLPHQKGALSMARSSAPNSANSKFFICFYNDFIVNNFVFWSYKNIWSKICFFKCWFNNWIKYVCKCFYNYNTKSDEYY